MLFMWNTISKKNHKIIRSKLLLIEMRFWKKWITQKQYEKQYLKNNNNNQMIYIGILYKIRNKYFSWFMNNLFQ